jgi:nicotinamide mononucleotide (NMN) deamidase PncC
MDDLVTSLIEKIHATDTRLVVAVTGGGSRAISDLLAVPGASKVLLEAVVPYAPTALDDFLGAPPEAYCSEPTARAMAVAAFERANRLIGNDAQLAGVGCTASLASDRPKHGSHRIHVALQTERVTQSWSVTLAKDRRSRAEEEKIAGRIVLATMSGAQCSASALGLEDDEKTMEKRVEAPRQWIGVHRGDASACLGVGEWWGKKPPKRLIFPGAFHPRHDGHRRMAEYANKRTSLPVEHEISITNVDKPPLDYIEMADRVGQFSHDERLWFTRAPAFVEKAQIFPGSTFVVGIDTITRIAESRYYGGDERKRDAAIDRLVELGARFLVFGRKIEGRYEVLSGGKLPPKLAAICEEVPEADFRVDVSSTELRANRAIKYGDAERQSHNQS